MMMDDDMSLVREFAARRSEPAFAALVERHVGLVHSAALRQAGDADLAGEITQAVFLVLARKAGALGPKTILSAWLYRTTRYAAADAVKARHRRQAREQEAYMQSTLNQPDPEPWTQLAPLLDDALAELGETDRAALVLRYFENKTAREIAGALRMAEPAAQKRVVRALEKLRAIFARRGVTLTATVIAGAVAANSVQAAPAGMAVAVIAAAKGAAAGGSTLTIIKGALKIMAWTKVKTAVVTGAMVLLAAGTTTVTVKEIQAHRTYPWQVRYANSETLYKAPAQVKIVPAKYPGGGSGSVGVGHGQVLGISVSAEGILESVYGQSAVRTLFLNPAPRGTFDYIAHLPSGNEQALRRESERVFGLTGRRETRETEVLLLKISSNQAPELKPADPSRLKPGEGSSSSRSGPGYYSCRNQTLSSLAGFLEGNLATPVIDQTGLKASFDIDLKWKDADYQHPDPDKLKRAVLDQLGLELVPDRQPIEMLLFEKVK
jgi:uncharacterized protein (TIGR03435 family)